jgi:erythromycin esterase-like protein
MIERISFLLCLLSIVVAHGIATAAEANSSIDPQLIARVASDACEARVVFLGSPGSHGSTKLLEFEGALIEKLVSDCHFGRVVFEAPIYGFLDLERRLQNGKVASKHEILDMVGGIWSDAKEFQPIAEFLAARLQKKAVALDGIDDQIGATGDYVQSHMTVELVDYLPESERKICKDKLQSHVDWKYDAAHPYSMVDKEALLTCLHGISDVLSKKNPHDTWIPRAVSANLSRYISRNFLYDNDRDSGFSARDRSMAMNFELLSIGRPKAKTIVWGATIHMAKSLKSVSGDVSKLEAFGPLLIQNLHLHPFVIATSSLSGTEGRAKPKPLPNAPANSIEAHSFENTSDPAVYVNAKQLSKFGPRPARIVTSGYVKADWKTVVDALVIFKEDTAISMIPRW